MCCDLYNAALQERRDGWRRGIRIGYMAQTKSLTEVRAGDADLSAMPAAVQRSALDRVDKAFQEYFWRCQSGKKPGYPRFRARRRYGSFAYPVTMNTVVSGAGHSARLVIPKMSDVKVNAYRPLRGRPLTVTIRRDAVGKWWACVTCDLGAAPDLAEVKSSVGVDVGLTTLAALSTGETIANPRHVERSAKTLANRQRAMVRRRKGSRSRERARVFVAKAYTHVRNQRLDYARKVAVDLVRRFDLIAFEDLNMTGLTRSMLAGPINNAAWGSLRDAVACKAEEAGKRVVLVNPRGTSQECSACGVIVEKTLADRIHRCTCGYVADRDVNAARNVLARALAPGVGAVSNPTDVQVGKARNSKTYSRKTVRT